MQHHKQRFNWDIPYLVMLKLLENWEPMDWSLIYIRGKADATSQAKV